jgi:hypothetical protein
MGVMVRPRQENADNEALPRFGKARVARAKLPAEFRSVKAKFWNNIKGIE